MGLFTIKLFGHLDMISVGIISEEEFKNVSKLITEGNKLADIYQDEEMIEENNLSGYFDELEFVNEDVIKEINGVKLLNDSNELLFEAKNLDLDENDEVGDIFARSKEDILVFFIQTTKGLVFEGEVESNVSPTIEMFSYDTQEFFLGDDYLGDYYENVLFNGEVIEKNEDDLNINTLSCGFVINGEVTYS